MLNIQIASEEFRSQTYFNTQKNIVKSPVILHLFNMKGLRLLSNFITISLIISTCLGAPIPMTEEDDEYDDDPEFPERNAAHQKLQEELEKQYFIMSTTTTTSTTTPPPPSTTGPSRFTKNRQKKKWILTHNVRGYQVFSDGPTIETELIKTRPMLRIRINIPHQVHDVEKIYGKRYVELKIRNWDKVHKVHVNVPFGYQTEDLRIIETRDYVDIIAPIYADIVESDT